MKKLNRKGFTLVTVLPTLKKTRQEAFNVTAQTAADFLEKQYQLSIVGEDTTITIPGTADTAISKDDLERAGLKAANYISATWSINETTGRACVKLTAATRTNVSETSKTLAGTTEAGEYYDVDETVATSTGC